MKILALGHRKRTGKDTLAQFLATAIRLNNRRINVQVCGFADELKDTVYRLYAWAGVKKKEWYEQHPHEREIILPKLGKTYRQLLIDFGNHCRLLDNNIWSLALLHRPHIDIMIIKDLRFPVEVEHVRALGGHCVKVVRPGIPEDTDGADEPLATFDGWDHIVENKGSLHDLNDHASFLIRKFNLGV